MAVDIDAVVSAIYDSLKTITGLSQTPEYPPESFTSGPLLIVMPESINLDSPTLGGGSFVGEFVVRAGIYDNRRIGLQQISENMQPFGQTVLGKLATLEAACTVSILGIAAEFGPVDYVGLDLFGWTFRIRTQIVE